MKRNTTGPPWNVGRPTVRAPSPPAGSVTDDQSTEHTVAGHITKVGHFTFLIAIPLM